MTKWSDRSEEEVAAEIDKQIARVCAGESSDHSVCSCIVTHAREIMHHWTGTNCTWVDDDITALGILAGMAIEANLYKQANIPKSMIADIEMKLAVHATVLE